MFSVLIPAFNEEKRIKACLNSVLSQQLKPAEVIVIDDGNDKTGQIVEKIRKTHRFVKYLRGPGKGRAAALNFGSEKARSRFMGVIDADCRAPEDWLLNAKKAFESGADAVSGPYRHSRNADAIEVAGQIVYDFFNDVFTMGQTNKIVGGNFFVRKDVFKKIKLNTRIRGGDDYNFSTELLQKGYTIKFDNHLYVEHEGEPKTLNEIYRQRRVWGRACWDILRKNGRLSMNTWIRIIYGLMIFLIPLLYISPFFGPFVVSVLLLPPVLIFFYGLLNFKRYTLTAVLLSPFIALLRMLSTDIGFFEAMLTKKQKSTHWRKQN